MLNSQSEDDFVASNTILHSSIILRDRSYESLIDNSNDVEMIEISIAPSLPNPSNPTTVCECKKNDEMERYFERSIRFNSLFYYVSCIRLWFLLLIWLDNS